MPEASIKAKRIRFNWQDAVAILSVILITSGVFLWSHFSASKKASSGARLLVTYNNVTVTDGLSIYSDSGAEMTYAVSFRRDLESGESHVDAFSGTKKELSVTSLRSISDFSSYDGDYMIITDPDGLAGIDGFSFLYGPQVDVKIFNGGFQVIKEDSPTHDCSKQGFVDLNNLPVVCLPNYINFRLTDGSGTQTGPDA